MNSRIFSGILILLTLLTTAVFLGAWSGFDWWQQVLVLTQLGLAPVMIYTARSTRFEQEILLFGWLGAVILPCLVPLVHSQLAKGLLWLLSGAALGWAATSHPFGMVFGLVGPWLFFTAKRWYEYDKFVLWQRFSLMAIGFIATSIPTILWITQSWDHFTGYTEMARDLYAVREAELIDFYAGQPPCARLNRVLPKPLVARLTTLYAASYEDYFEYPVPQYPYQVALKTWFVAQFLLIVTYFGYSVWRRFANGNHWLHLLVLLTLGFVGFQLWYPPATTYKVYTAFFTNVTGGVVLWHLVNRVSQTTFSRVTCRVIAIAYMLASVLVVHYSIKHLQYISHAYRHSNFPYVSLDQEFETLKEMSGRLKINGDDQVVYASIESWIASGKDTHSLWESVMLGLAPTKSNADGVVFKNNHVNFKLVTSGGDLACRFPTREERLTSLSELLSPLHLSGLVLSDFTTEGAYSFYTKTPQNDRILIARMLRSQETQYRFAAFAFEADPQASISLDAGQYVLCVWTNTDPGHASLQVSSKTVRESPKLITASAGPLSTLSPVPIFLDLGDAAGQVNLSLLNNRPGSSVVRCRIYRIGS